MNTAFSLLIMFMAFSIGLIGIAVAILVMGLAGAPGALIFDTGRTAGNRSLLRLGLVLAAVGQSYEAGAYAVFVVAVLRAFSVANPEVPTWPLWIAAFFHSDAGVVYAMKERPEQPTAQHYSLPFVSLASFVIFLLAVLVPSWLAPFYQWVPNFDCMVHPERLAAVVPTDEEIKKRAGENHQSIESFFRNTEYLQSMQLLMRGDPKRNPQEKLDGMRKLADKILDENRHVSEVRLNAIYARWGTEYQENFVRGVTTLRRGLEALSKDDFGMADAYFATWDTWWRDNHRQVFLELHRRFGFEVSSRASRTRSPAA